MKKPTLSTLFLIVFMDLIGFGILMPLLPYFAAQFHSTAWEIGILFASYSLMQFLFAPVWGRISDRAGRRPIILLSLFGSTASYLLFAFSTSYWLLLVSRVFAGICGANIAVANAYIADITTAENRSRGMGVIGAAFGLGFIFGPVMAAVLGRWGVEVPVYAAAAMSGLSLVFAWRFLPESLPTGGKPATVRGGWLSDFRKVAFNRYLVLLAVLAFLCNAVIALWETTFAIYLSRTPEFHYSIAEVGYLIAFVGVLVAMFQGGLIGRLVKKCGEGPLLMASVIGYGGGMVLIPLASHLSGLLTALAVLAVGQGLSRPVVLGLASQATAGDEQGFVLGIFQALGSLARIIAPILGGGLLEINLSLPYWMGGGVMLAAIGLAASVKKPVRAVN